MQTIKPYGIRYEDAKGNLKDKFFKTESQRSTFVDKNSGTIVILAWRNPE